MAGEGACSCDEYVWANSEYIVVVSVAMVYKWGRCVVYVLCERDCMESDVWLERIPMCVLNCVASGNEGIKHDRIFAQQIKNWPGMVKLHFSRERDIFFDKLQLGACSSSIVGVGDPEHPRL